MKLIQLPHKVCGMTCMVNGLEDLFEAQTGTRLPDWFLFYMSGMAGFAYVKVNKAPAPRFVGWERSSKRSTNSERSHRFQVESCEGRSFQTPWPVMVTLTGRAGHPGALTCATCLPGRSSTTSFTFQFITC
jgi:hypothetical protein